MKKILHLVLGVVFLLGLSLASVMPASAAPVDRDSSYGTAGAFPEYPRACYKPKEVVRSGIPASCVSHNGDSDRRLIAVWSRYNGIGEIGYVERGKHATTPKVIRSLYIPKKCTLWINGAKWMSSRKNSGRTWNIGRYPFAHADLDLHCKVKM